MKHMVLLLALFVLPVPVQGSEESTPGNELLTVAAALRAEQVGLKDLSLRVVEILVGDGEASDPQERASMEAVNRRLTAAGTVASYEASRVEMLVHIREEHQPRFARRLADELQATAAALAVDEGIVREKVRMWSPRILERVGAPEEAVRALRLSVEAAVLELKKLGGETI